MGLFSGGGDLQLRRIDPVDVAFNNLFVGSERFFTFENGSDRYSILLKQGNLGLDAKVLLGVKIAGFDAEILLKSLSNLGAINEKFADIDLNLFDDGMKFLLINCLFEREIAAFSARIGFDVTLEDASFDSTEGGNFKKEIGVNVVKNDAVPVTFNLRLGNELLQLIISKFEKIEASEKEVDDGFPFEWYLEVGKTQLDIGDYESLGEYDIIFLDENSSIRTGKYQIKGPDEMELVGTLSGCNLVVENGKFQKRD
jgi:hypothetical protein